jgi:hypothetical protein
MESINDTLNNMTVFFNSRNIPFVVGGAYGIELACNKHSILPNFKVNNLDIFYMSNTPITPEMIFTYRRKQTAPCSSLTYVTEDGFDINLTMIRRHNINIITFGSYKIMHPRQLISYYYDALERTLIQDLKIFILSNIIELESNNKMFVLTNTNQIISENNSLTPSQKRSKRPLNFTLMLQTVSE